MGFLGIDIPEHTILGRIGQGNFNAAAGQTGQGLYDTASSPAARFFDPAGLFKSIFSPYNTREDPDLQRVDPEMETGDDETMARLRQFFDEMNAPLNMEDPRVKQLLTTASNRAMRTAGGRGLQGGLSVANTQQAGIGALATEQGRRQQLAQGALGQMAGYQSNLDRLRYQKFQDAQGREDDRLAALFAMKQQENAGPLGIAGGVIGSIFGGPMGGQAGYQAGSAIGARHVQPGGLYAPPKRRIS